MKMDSKQLISLTMVLALALFGSCKRKSEQPVPRASGETAPPTSTPVIASSSPTQSHPAKLDAPLPLVELAGELDSDELFEGDPLTVNLHLRNPRLLEKQALDSESDKPSALSEDVGPAMFPADWAHDARVTLERTEKDRRIGIFSDVPATDFVATGNGLSLRGAASTRLVVPNDKARLIVGAYVLSVTCSSARFGSQTGDLPKALSCRLEFNVVPSTNPPQRATHAARLARLAHQQKKFEEATRLSRQALDVNEGLTPLCVEQHLILADSLIGLGKFDDAMAAYDALIAAAEKSADVREIAKNRKELLARLMNKTSR